MISLLGPVVCSESDSNSLSQGTNNGSIKHKESWKNLSLIRK